VGAAAAGTSGAAEWADNDASGTEKLKEPRWPLVRRVAAMMAGAVVLGILGWGAGRWLTPPELTRIEIGEWYVTGIGAGGEQIWRHKLPEAAVDRFPSGSVWTPGTKVVADLDGDGRREGLVWHMVPPASRETDTLYCFHADGTVRWRFQPQREVRSARGVAAPTYNGSVVRTVRYGGGKTGVLAVANHRPYYPAHVVLLSAQGELVREYWHSGNFLASNVLDLDRDGRDEIYLGGISNAYKAPVMVVLDPDRMDGASHDAIEPSYDLAGFRSAKERARVVFPRTEASRAQEPYNSVQVIFPTNDQLVVGVLECKTDGKANGTLLFHFNQGLQLTEVSRGDNHTQLWNILRREGVLDRDWTQSDLEALREIRYLSGGPRAGRRETE
jgi:hypothetical protein